MIPATVPKNPTAVFDIIPCSTDQCTVNGAQALLLTTSFHHSVLSLASVFCPKFHSLTSLTPSRATYAAQNLELQSQTLVSVFLPRRVTISRPAR